MAEPVPDLAIVGPGRAGLALASALVRAGAARKLRLVGRSATVPPHPLLAGDPPQVQYAHGLATLATPDLSAVLLAVPDAAIRNVAEDLARAGIPVAAPVLHLSGTFGSDLLSPLAERGNPTGSIHPLVALADATGADQLRGAWFAIEGATAAVAMADRIVAFVEGRVLQVPAGGKPLYHAAAAAASNFVVALLAVAESWMQSAGVPPHQARPALAALAAGAARNVERCGPVEALTGPLVRGDVATVQAHLAQLSRADRHLYSVLGLSTLAIARERGLDSATAEVLMRLLEGIE